MPVDPVVVIVAQLAIGWLFGHAALHKLRAFDAFRVTLQSYRLLPARGVTAAAGALLACEAAIALGAAAGLAAALLGGAGLLVLYGLAMAINLVRDREALDCGCGGPPQPISWYLVARNGVLAGTALLALFPSTGRALGWVDGLIVGAVLLALAALYATAQAAHAARAELEEWV
jgi:hypothetical protein